MRSISQQALANHAEHAKEAALKPIPVDAAGSAHITPPEAGVTSTIGDPAPPAHLSEGMAAEARIGISFTGNPTAKHDGVEIAGVQPGGPADKIDLKTGDVIISIDGHYLYTFDDLRTELLRHERGRGWQYDIDATGLPTTTTWTLALKTRLLADDSN